MLKITNIELNPKETYVSSVITVTISVDVVSWQDIKDIQTNWLTIKNTLFKNWNEFKNYIP